VRRVERRRAAAPPRVGGANRAGGAALASRGAGPWRGGPAGLHRRRGGQRRGGPAVAIAGRHPAGRRRAVAVGVAGGAAGAVRGGRAGERTSGASRVDCQPGVGATRGELTNRRPVYLSWPASKKIEIKRTRSSASRVISKQGRYANRYH